MYCTKATKNIDTKALKMCHQSQKNWSKATLKDIKNLIINKKFLMAEPVKGEPVTTCMDVNNSKIQSDGSIDKLKLRIVVIGDFQNR